MDHDAVLRKIQKCMAIADEKNGANETMRETALRQAHALMQRIGIEASDVENESHASRYGDVIEKKFDRPHSEFEWPMMIAGAVARLNCCIALASDHAFFVMGRSLRVDVTWAMVSSLIVSAGREIDRAWERSDQSNTNHGWGDPEMDATSLAFRRQRFYKSHGAGIADAVTDRVNALKAAGHSGIVTGPALVLRERDKQDESAAEDWAAEHHLYITQGYSDGIDTDEFSRGRRTGAGMDIGTDAPAPKQLK